MSCYLPISIRGTGRSVPAKVLANSDFLQWVDTNDEWIVTRTGIRERRIVSDGQSTLDLAYEASVDAMNRAGLAPADIDLVICATVTPEHPMPATACFLQHRLGLRQVPAFDISAACSGFLYAFITAAQFVNQGNCRNVLVVAAECMSRYTDYTDRGTCILFGDGAGAVILGQAERKDQGVHHWLLACDGSGAEMIIVPAGGAKMPASTETVRDRQHFLKMNGRDVYKFAVHKMQEVIEQAMAAQKLGPADIAMVIPHQSNLRIIESATQKLGLSPDKVYVNIDRYGNTSAASVGIALDEVMKAGLVKSGQWLLLAAFGAGLTWGSALVKV